MLKFCCICFLALSFMASAQTSRNFGLKYYGLSLHPGGDEQAHLMPHRLDEGGVAVLNFGGIASYQQLIYRDFLSVKIAQGIYTDSGGLLSGHTHIGFRIRLTDIGRHDVQFGFGPTLIYRKSWNVKPGYESTGLFKDKGNVQYKFVMYGGEIEYNYALNDTWDLSAHVLPGYPLLVGFGIGFRYWVFRDLELNR